MFKYEHNVLSGALLFNLNIYEPGFNNHETSRPIQLNRTDLLAMPSAFRPGHYRTARRHPPALFAVLELPQKYPRFYLSNFQNIGGSFHLYHT